MSFKFPSFNLQSLQESLAKVDMESISKSFQSSGKAVSEYSEHLKESIQPLTSKTQSLISAQLQQVQQLASTHSDTNIEVSDLPEDYLILEKNCDLLLKLYTDLIQYTNSTFGTLSYDYPPGNSALNKIKDAHVGSLLSSKFNQLKNVSTPQEMENILLGTKESETVETEVVTLELPKTLYGKLSEIATKASSDFNETCEPLSFALLQISSAYVQIATARLDQDKKIMSELNHALVQILNEQFIKVTELRKRVYGARSDFDLLRSQTGEDEENEELIAKEDDLVSSIEVAVVEMRRLVRPSKNIDLLKVFVTVQRDYFEAASKSLTGLLADLDKISISDEDEE
ncbi:Bin/amphiphysin/Rvs domain for vesicular trafficking family protein [Clavispora lusitaniae]|uniref:Protein GVP36 n=2 Tax=Clavispora lusitaniae TaxID=36911 RepID=C4Y6Q9_CLAL4|nr:uncharacterized protein CLUG_03843 [Clavispora lusitaniae ATCC 42720]EEQ39715.1 hypothetical protein CLUG_03843 [Clavispora lusitaniae ATCC 42720]KAF5210582.1 hypothetical protein E0198_003459 [Clavispora lusitaniae]KAF7582311.1 Bin/amphiphysin/Rvs domain for vesicular trafficking family protein [Clavispora lusitaniae]OVF10860.1 hypothetical protein A9F13_01g02915 [Clavispora lusitaniae]